MLGQPSLLSTINFGIIVMIFLVFTFMGESIDSFVMNTWMQLSKTRPSQAQKEGEKLLNVWLLMGTICVGIIWMMREELTADFNQLIRQQCQTEEMLSMQIHLMFNMARKVVDLERQLCDAIMMRDDYQLGEDAHPGRSTLEDIQ